jgi:2'-5' RNA ligase
MRTFIALGIPLSPSCIKLLNSLKQKLSQERIRWVNFDTLHLTLFFLGEASQMQVNEIDNAFKTHISSFTPLEITLKGIGTFGQKNTPKVLWLGVEESETLKKLHAEVNRVVSPIGFTSDQRGFNPHITIGRIKSIDNIQLIESIAKEASNQPIQRSTVDRVNLYKSTLTPNGAIYSPLLEQQLMGKV